MKRAVKLMYFLMIYFRLYFRQFGGLFFCSTLRFQFDSQIHLILFTWFFVLFFFSLFLLFFFVFRLWEFHFALHSRLRFTEMLDAQWARYFVLVSDFLFGESGKKTFALSPVSKRTVARPTVPFASSSSLGNVLCAAARTVHPLCDSILAVCAVTIQLCMICLWYVAVDEHYSMEKQSMRLQNH